jgi:APA family basic amino acid/polyamine antiporter
LVLAVWVYTGFETISTCAQEARNPTKDLAIGMLSPTRISTCPDPIVVALRSIGPQWSWLVTLVSIGTLIGMSATLPMMLYGQIRVFFIMAADRQLPARFAKVHPRYRTPVTATRFTGMERHVWTVCEELRRLVPGYLALPPVGRCQRPPGTVPARRLQKPI